MENAISSLLTPTTTVFTVFVRDGTLVRSYGAYGGPFGLLNYPQGATINSQEAERKRPTNTREHQEGTYFMD